MSRLVGTLKPKGQSPQHIVEAKRSRRMEAVDSLPDDWRVLVHEYGYCVVDALRCCGVVKSKHARHIIGTILSELSPISGSFSSQGSRAQTETHLVLIPAYPSERMIEASMATVSTFDMTITKREKHRLRLQAAIDAAIPGHRKASP